MMKKEIILKAKVLAEKYQEEYEYVGFRAQEQPFKLGPISHCSKVWDDGEETDAQLDGISTIAVDKVESLYNQCGYYPYYGDHAAIIAGNRATWGQDQDELVIEDAVVFEILA